MLNFLYLLKKKRNCGKGFKLQGILKFISSRIVKSINCDRINSDSDAAVLNSKKN